MFRISRTILDFCRLFAVKEWCSCFQSQVPTGVVLQHVGGVGGGGDGGGGGQGGNGRCVVHHADLPIKGCAAGYVSKLILTISVCII